MKELNLTLTLMHIQIIKLYIRYLSVKLTIMAIYVLYTQLMGQSVHTENPNWELLAKQYNFRIIKNTSTIATIDASPETIASLHMEHPEIQVTVEKKYHTASP
jgi:hypothetical protein